MTGERTAENMCQGDCYRSAPDTRRPHREGKWLPLAHRCYLTQASLLAKNAESEWIEDVNPGRKQGKSSMALVLAVVFLDVTPEAQVTRQKNEQMGLRRTERLCTATETISKVNITSDAQTPCLRDLTPQREPSTAAEAPPKMRGGPARSITLTPWHMLHHNPQSPAGLQERKVGNR
ncbi:hypothetical protein QTO34_012687 [Cnephaeus nilssonii]|uniref:Uncharacterized protein n=1 Tax=Cnephaeus nilssonii TaxID=3371016 RepID=A0AA40LD80_CNENI|nr:hypothetical protein QTO34_012687 [Eptesicus nilssonii]